MDPILIAWIIIVSIVSFTFGWCMKTPVVGYTVQVSEQTDAAYVDLAPSRRVRAVAWSQPALIDCREGMGSLEAIIDFDIRGRLVGIEFVGLCTSSVLISKDGEDVQIGSNDTNLAKSACPPPPIL